MKGFTLIETIIYIAVSTIIVSSITLFSLAYFETERELHVKALSEMDEILMIQSLYEK